MKPFRHHILFYVLVILSYPFLLFAALVDNALTIRQERNMKTCGKCGKTILDNAPYGIIKVKRNFMGLCMKCRDNI